MTPLAQSRPVLPAGEASSAPPEVIGTGGGWLGTVVAPLLASLCLVAMAWRFSTITADDSYITFRFSDNLARGHGPVWNPGERVEGYTNFLWMAGLGVLIRLGLDPVVWSKILGTAVTLLTLFEVPRILKHYPWSFPWSTPFALGIVTLGPWLPTWAVQGMETPLFTWLLTLAVRLTLDDLHQPVVPALSLRAPLVLALLAMTRPEGLMVAGILALQGCLARQRGERGRFLLAFAVPFALLYAPYFVWRVSYYGDLLPNTFYAKTGARMEVVRRGGRYLADFARTLGPALFLFVLKPAYGSWLRRPDRVILAVAVPYAAYVALVGGDYMAYSRFLVPLVPIFVALVADGLVSFYQWARALRRIPLWIALGIYGLLLATPAAPTWREVRNPAYDGPFGPAEPEARIATWLAKNAPPGTSIGTTIIGKIGYYSRLEVRDLLGITEPAVAHKELQHVGDMAGHDKMDLAYVMGRNPTLFYFGRSMEPGPGRVAAARDTPTVRARPGRKTFMNRALRPLEGEFNRRYRGVHVDFGDVGFDLWVLRGSPWPAATAPAPPTAAAPSPAAP